ncbi:hypothetical protein LPJ81_004176, partial [Coemansia sp. IMI 209127]
MAEADKSSKAKHDPSSSTTSLVACASHVACREVDDPNAWLNDADASGQQPFRPVREESLVMLDGNTNDAPEKNASANYSGSTCTDSVVSEGSQNSYELKEKLPVAGKHDKTLEDNSKDSKDESENSPFEVVRTAVSNNDDVTTPSMTFRTHILGVFFVCLISFVNQFYWERDNPIALNLLIVQLLCYPMGVGLAWMLPKRTLNSFGYRWTMNPGPFTIKEHVLISLMSNASAFMALTVDVFAILRLYYNPSFPLWTALLLLLSGQLFAYSLAGLTRTLLVIPAPMIWPSSLINASLFRTFHESPLFGNAPIEDGEGNSHPSSANPGIPERQARNKANIMQRLQNVRAYFTGMSRTRFFWVCFVCSFAWYFVPGYLLQVLSTVSVLCLIAPNNHLANMLGDGKQGLGFLAFSLDWSVFSNAFLNSPIATPFWAACNLFVGFVLVFWIALPIAYFNDLWGSARLPLYSAKVYTLNGTEYNITRIMRNGIFNEKAYNEY